METSMKVNVGLLEILMNLAGELVLGRNQLREAVTAHDEKGVSLCSQRISLVTSELQEAIMRTRLQPLGVVFDKFPRLVRDIAQETGKEIELALEGKEVELDKSLVEGLSEPLTAVVRLMAQDHCEPAEERRRAGKAAAARIALKAYHEAGLVVIEARNDGRGGGGLSAETRERIVALGGKADESAVPGKETLVRLKMPLTLAIIPALVATVGGVRFALPQANVSELIHLSAEEVGRSVDVVGDAEVLKLRNDLLPIFRLADLLGLERTFTDVRTGEEQPDRRERIADRRGNGAGVEKDSRRGGGRRQSAQSALHAVVVTAGELRYALVVDGFEDTEEIVVKPLGQHLKGLREYAGATIMGDGGVALILDAVGLAENVCVRAVSVRERSEQEGVSDARQTETLLLFQNGPEEWCSVPLHTVQRIERIAAAQIEHVGGMRSMQYRCGTLPLRTLSDVAKVPELGLDRDLVVVVSQVGGREIGLLGTMPVDVVETDVPLDTETMRQPGIRGSRIVNDKTVLMVEVEEMGKMKNEE